MTAEERAQMLDAMGDIAPWVSMLTGIKRMFIDQGWSEQAAEMMVHQTLEHARAHLNSTQGATS